MTAPVRIAILGAAGRMGQALISSARDLPGLALAALIERPGAPAIGQSVDGVRIGADLAAVLDHFDVLIDFTRPASSLAALELCSAAGKPVVLGTTGFSPAEQAEVAAAARFIAVCQSANFSVGVNVLLRLLADAARALGPGYDVEIVEAHHRHKVDAPSGTALALGRAVATALGRDLEAVAVYGREGQTGARDSQTIGFATVRGGDVIGDHTVLFLGEGERLELSHRASSRGNFAGGALRAAAWLHGRPPGLYDMKAVLGL